MKRRKARDALIDICVLVVDCSKFELTESEDKIGFMLIMF